MVWNGCGNLNLDFWKQKGKFFRAAPYTSFSKRYIWILKNQFRCCKFPMLKSHRTTYIFTTFNQASLTPLLKCSERKTFIFHPGYLTGILVQSLQTTKTEETKHWENLSIFSTKIASRLTKKRTVFERKKFWLPPAFLSETYF